MKYRYFIKDGWNDETVGNPDGYSSMKGANIALSKPYKGCPQTSLLVMGCIRQDAGKGIYWHSDLFY